MKSVLKVVFMSMYHKKGRSIMLIISILFSVGLIYAVLSLSPLTKDIILNQYRKEYGNTNVIINNQDGSFIQEEVILDESNFDYIVATYNLYGYTYLDEDLTVNMFGFTNEEIDQIYDLKMTSALDGDFEGNQILIGQNNSELYDLSIGDTIDVAIQGQVIEFIVYGIVEEGDSFLDNTANTVDMIVYKDFIVSELALTKPNIYLLNILDTENIFDISLDNPNLIVNDLYGNESVQSDLQQVTLPLALMTASLILISCFIISSTFKIIVIDRMVFIGTIRSIGGTKQLARRVLVLESVFYGLIGSVIGIVMGVIFLFFTIRLYFGAILAEGITVNYVNIQYLFISLLIGILLSVISAYIPIVKSLNYSIKDIIFEKIKNAREVSITKTIIGSLLLIIGYLVMKNVGTNDYMLFSIMSMLLAASGAVLLIPQFMMFIAPAVKILTYPIFRNHSTLAINNIKHDKSLINNIVLLTIGLGVIFMINSFAGDMGRSVNEIYDKAQYDMIIIYVNLKDEFLDEARNVDGVSNIYAYQFALNVETNRDFPLLYLEGVDLEVYEQYGWDHFGDSITSEVLDAYNSTDSIIVTTFTAKRYGLSIGDKIEILNDGVGYTVTIVGTYSSVIQNGNVSYINPVLFREIYGEDTLKIAFIEAEGDLIAIKKEIKALYPYGVLPIMTYDELKLSNQSSNAMIFGIMRAISILAMMIGAVGIINNFVVSFISRRKLIATLRSLGLSQKGTVKLFLTESLLVGTIGSLLGVLFGVVLYQFMGFVIEGMNITSETLALNPKEMLFVFVSGLILSVLTSILPAINMSRRNIVAEIKYE